MAIAVNGYLIEARMPNPMAPDLQVRTLWIGIMESAARMIAAVPGEQPSVIDRGPRVLVRAHSLGLKLGEVRKVSHR